jgi:multiple sugar transport system permease protein
MPTVALITIWWTVGFNILLFIAGLKNISPELYEASDIEGANALQQFKFITWPLIWPITALVLTLQLIFQLKIFDQMYLLTGGGPFNSTLVVLQLVYKQGFQLNRGGYASAIAMVLFVIIIIASVLQYQVLRNKDKD